MFNVGLFARRPELSGVTLVGANIVRTQSLSNFNCPVPTGTQAGDLLIAFLGVGVATDLNLNLVTTGFTEHDDMYLANTTGFHGVNLAVYRRVLAGAPPSNITAQGRASTADTFLSVVSLRGVDPTTPFRFRSIRNSNAVAGNFAGQLFLPNQTFSVDAGEAIVNMAFASSFYNSQGSTGIPSALTGFNGYPVNASLQRRASNDSVSAMGVSVSTYPAPHTQTTKAFLGSAYNGGDYGAHISYAIRIGKQG